LTLAAASTRRTAAASAAALAPDGGGGGPSYGGPAGEGVLDGRPGDDSDGAGAAGSWDAAAAVPGRAAGDGSALTRMPQPASSVAAPAAASTPTRHLDPTSASSMTSRVFRRDARHPPASRRV
jgi:hypothetical protein